MPCTALIYHYLIWYSVTLVWRGMKSSVSLSMCLLHQIFLPTQCTQLFSAGVTYQHFHHWPETLIEIFCSHKYFSVTLRPRNIFNMSNWKCWPDYVSTVFFHVNNIEWCQPKVISIRSFIYEKVQFNTILTTVCGHLWMGQVDLYWYISSSFMIYDLGTVIYQTYQVWQLLIWGNLALDHWLE